MSPGAGAPSPPLRAHGIMQPDPVRLRRWEMERRLAAQRPHAQLPQARPAAALGVKGALAAPSASFTLIQSVPDYLLRNQGDCGSCWVWASTALAEVALNSQFNIVDRLSVQYFQSNNTATASCYGGSLTEFCDWYNNNGQSQPNPSPGVLVPWSNPRGGLRRRGHDLVPAAEHRAAGRGGDAAPVFRPGPPAPDPAGGGLRRHPGAGHRRHPGRAPGQPGGGLLVLHQFRRRRRFRRLLGRPAGVGAVDQRLRGGRRHLPLLGLGRAHGDPGRLGHHRPRFRQLVLDRPQPVGGHRHPAGPVLPHAHAHGLRGHLHHGGQSRQQLWPLFLLRIRDPDPGHPAGRHLPGRAARGSRRHPGLGRRGRAGWRRDDPGARHHGGVAALQLPVASGPGPGPAAGDRRHHRRPGPAGRRLPWPWRPGQQLERRPGRPGPEQRPGLLGHRRR